jgi:hypothetical protein
VFEASANCAKFGMLSFAFLGLLKASARTNIEFLASSKFIPQYETHNCRNRIIAQIFRIQVEMAL